MGVADSDRARGGRGEVITCLLDSGTGRPWVVLAEAGGPYSGYSKAAREVLGLSGRVILLEVPKVTVSNWHGLSAELESELSSRGVRHASFLSFGGTSVLTQHLCLSRPKLGRSLVFVDATSRGHPSRIMRIADAIERTLPLGLPLRKNIKGFDSKPSLHRFRCPVMIAVSKQATDYEEGESKMMAKALPTAWYVKLEGREEEQLGALLVEFQGVAAKCPQKRGGKRAPQMPSSSL